MTNIIELAAVITVSLLTNISETTNERGCITCDGIRRNNWLMHHVCDKKLEPYSPATQKWVRQEVVEVTRMESKDGKYCAEISRKTLSFTSQQFNSRTVWEPDGKEEMVLNSVLPLFSPTNSYGSNFILIMDATNWIIKTKNLNSIEFTK